MTWISNVLLIIVTVASILITRPYAEEYFINERIYKVFGYDPNGNFVPQSSREEINFSEVHNYDEFQNFMTDTLGDLLFTSEGETHAKLFMNNLPIGKLNIRTQRRKLVPCTDM